MLAPWRPQRALVRLLVAYVLLWSYVDVRTERDPDADPRLYDALLHPLCREAPAGALPAPDDAGYLAALLAECQRSHAALPSWATVQPIVLCLTDDGRAVQAINHGPPAEIERRLRAWATARDPARSWHEQCAAASSPLTIHALMALAAHPNATASEASATRAAYGPVSALGVLCDHLIDQAEDDAFTNHSYLVHFGSPTARPRALHDLADRGARAVRQLRDGERHTVILAAMAAMFLAHLPATHPANRAASTAILEALDWPAPQLRAVMTVRRRFERRARPATAD